MVFSIESVSKEYRSGTKVLHALDSVSLKIEDGEIFGIIGKSGAGKSTLLRCLNLLERPTSGRILLGDTDLTALSQRNCATHASGSVSCSSISTCCIPVRSPPTSPSLSKWRDTRGQIDVPASTS